MVHWQRATLNYLPRWVSKSKNSSHRFFFLVKKTIILLFSSSTIFLCILQPGSCNITLNFYQPVGTILYGNILRLDRLIPGETIRNAYPWFIFQMAKCYFFTTQVVVHCQKCASPGCHLLLLLVSPIISLSGVFRTIIHQIHALFPMMLIMACVLPGYIHVFLRLMVFTICQSLRS